MGRTGVEWRTYLLYALDVRQGRLGWTGQGQDRMGTWSSRVEPAARKGKFVQERSGKLGVNQQVAGLAWPTPCLPPSASLFPTLCCTVPHQDLWAMKMGTPWGWEAVIAGLSWSLLGWTGLGTAIPFWGGNQWGGRVVDTSPDHSTLGSHSSCPLLRLILLLCG